MTTRRNRSTPDKEKTGADVRSVIVRKRQITFGWCAAGAIQLVLLGAGYQFVQAWQAHGFLDAAPLLVALPLTIGLGLFQMSTFPATEIAVVDDKVRVRDVWGFGIRRPADRVIALDQIAAVKPVHVAGGRDARTLHQIMTKQGDGELLQGVTASEGAAIAQLLGVPYG